MSVESFAERALATVPSGRLRRYSLAPRPRGLDLVRLCREALRNPVGSTDIATLARDAERIVVIVSDASRDEPREEMLAAVFEVLPRERVTLVVAAGTHAATDAVVPDAYRDLPVVVHDGARLDRCVDVGATPAGTRVRILRDVAEADLVIVTGRVHPHYFAGYSGGVKGLFPGCAFKDDILQNHLLKADRSARLGLLDGNRCRLDMEDAALRVKGKVAILNVLSDCDGNPQAAVSGHPVLAHRVLAAEARSLFLLRVPRSRVVVVADRPPVTRSLYQASKLLPPAGPVLEEGGTVILVAECDEGIEPRERVNEGIYRLGVSRALPARHRVLLVSALPHATVAQSYAEPMPTLVEALSAAGADPGSVIPVVYRAGEAIVEASHGA
jgi:nickel-dependent lactate racemase